MRTKKHTTMASPVLIFLLTCLVICHAEEADIEMVYVRVNAINEIIPLDQQSGLVPVINFRNNGPHDITAANGSDLNFNIKAYLSSDPDKREAEATFALNLGYLQGDSLIVDDLKKPVLSQAVRGFTLDGVEIVIPSDACEQVDYFCVEVVLVKDGFNDTNLNNNIYCARFALPLNDDNIGIFKCYIDIETTHAVVTAPDDVTYLAGDANNITFNATIINTGGIILNKRHGGDFALYPTVYLTDSAQLESASVKERQDDISIRYTDDVVPDTSMTLEAFVSSITLPTDNDKCSKITHVCLNIQDGTGNYTDFDTTNNDYCLEFGAVNDGKAGFKYGCPVNGIDLQIQTFEVVDWKNTVYNIGVDNTITVDALIANLGDDPILDSDVFDNYDFKIYLSNQRHDLGQATVTVDCTMNLTSTTNLKDGLVYGDTLNTKGIVATCKLPADTEICRAYQSLCLEIVKGANAPYTETVTDNNIVCEQFGDMIGNKSCPDLDIDITPTDMTVTPSQQPYPLDIKVPADVTIRVTNVGPGDLPEVDDPAKNFNVTVWLSNKDHTHTDGIRVLLPATVANITHLKQGLDKDDIIGITLSPVNIKIPEDSCQQLLYLCVTVSLDESSIYKEVDPDSDDICVEFGPLPDKAGETECFVDIAATNVVVSSPSNLAYKPGFETDIVVQLSVDNNGGLTVPEATEGHNFVAVAFLTDSADLRTAAVKLPATVTSDGFTEEIPGKAMSKTLPTTMVKVTIPTDKARCEELTHFCMDLTHDGSKYTDKNSTNDFICIEFGPVADGKAGIKQCNVSIDLSTDNLIVSPEVPKYDFDVDTNAHIEITVTDNGAGDLPEAMEPNVNYEVRAYLTNSEEFETATYRKELPNLNYDLVTLRQAISNGMEISFDTERAQINIPLDECLSITHICLYVTIKDSDTSVFEDPNLDNNDDCLMFGLVGEGKAGVIPCFIDIAAIRLRVIEPRRPRYPAGRDTELTVELTVHNYGALSLSSAPANNYNFFPLIYLTNNGNLDRATRVIQQAEVEARFDHEVASTVTVILADFMITVNVPEDEDTCRSITHICLRIDHNEALYTDGYEPNDKTCMPIDPVCVGDESPADEQDRGLPIEYTAIIIVVVVLAVLIGVTVALCNGCKKRSPKYVSA
ncbi:uncharacterized protein [Ptychodera flava]|uniref:uncharacterized protein n=1 Tax=Ptychodera flava TaxID=63121 RepID=UPI003969F69D